MITATEKQDIETNGSHHQADQPAATIKLDLSNHYAALVTQLLARQSRLGLDCICVGLTSCTPGEGVTTSAINVALTAAQQYARRVLLVDATSEQAGVERRLGLQPGPGIVELTTGPSLMGDCFSTSSTPGLSVLGNGLKDRQSELNIDPRVIGDMLEVFRTEFDLVVFDMSHAHEVSDCFALASVLDGVLLVLEAGKGDSHVAGRVVDRFKSCRAQVIGTILSKCC